MMTHLYPITILIALLGLANCGSSPERIPHKKIPGVGAASSTKKILSIWIQRDDLSRRSSPSSRNLPSPRKTSGDPGRGNIQQRETGSCTSLRLSATDQLGSKRNKE